MEIKVVPQVGHYVQDDGVAGSNPVIPTQIRKGFKSLDLKPF